MKKLTIKEQVETKGTGRFTDIQSAGLGTMNKDNNMKAQEIDYIKKEAKVYFPTITKMYTDHIEIITNKINGRLMYIMPVKIDNGGAGTYLLFSIYVDKEISFL